MSKVAIVMGSDSDWRILEAAHLELKSFGIEVEVEVLSAHRTPETMLNWAKNASENGFSIVIAGAGGAAHLPGMIASATSLPVIGVPVSLSHLDGMDSLLSIVQMPAGVPVATVSIDGAKNAALLAIRMLGVSDLVIRSKMDQYREDLKLSVEQKNRSLKARLS
ncbi:5-(carboxyamino)imidazole ribonucleotide mutase [Candidatus Aquiluna sp. UB-MaderosW2red]|jgi:5-(carboxyamino)imidazole ribonucleotide mutase|uniref:5-(carboxyamino)imidazole ribonucleotide mutase n=1 Tax=Candidatus Aquiluna sp. UB-MaderosW2red TaxID=1855377 RepID=UPI000875D0CA|nr:5-(carboxyamino)imidazole ribonucleotide mutase [Candidatus Aquiluna sp. UB-MaderosW2red]SCX07784.1 5-(carboxyamino)imidazole ribonucleotide mutase [Candidatus Aquiluna sp. UB-MaderosW2red]